MWTDWRRNGTYTETGKRVWLSTVKADPHMQKCRREKMQTAAVHASRVSRSSWMSMSLFLIQALNIVYLL